MERRNREPEPIADWGFLELIPEDQVVQFPLEGGFRLLTPMPTGLVEITVSSLAELQDLIPKRRLYDAPITAIDDTEFQAWKEGLITPEAIVKAANRELERREAEGDEETIPCISCEGEPYSESCFCVLGGIFSDPVSDADEAAALGTEGTPDPNCDTCKGSGVAEKDCLICEGSGKMVQYPRVIFRNEGTGAECSVEIDLAALVASGEADVEVGGLETVYPNGQQVADKDIRFDLSRYVGRNLEEIGLNRKNAVVREDYVGRIDPQQVKIASAPSHWRKFGDTVEYNQSAMTAAEVLADAQGKLLRAYAWPPRKIKDEQGLVIAGEWTMRPPRPLEDTLTDLRVAAGEKGYTVSLALGFIATDELGPCFFLMAPNGETQPLSGDYAIRESLESAWIMFQKIEEDLPDHTN